MSEQFLTRPKLRQIQPGDEILLHGEAIGQIANFWQWACSDLRENTMRGLYGEWLVAVLLGLQTANRENWTPYDLRHGAITIGVKTFSYLQPWAQVRRSTAVFNGLRSRAWDPDTATFSATAAYHTDWFVFCLQICENGDEWNALDLDQWQFFLVPGDIIRSRGSNSISLGQLKKLAEPLTAERFRAEGQKRMNITPAPKVVLRESSEP